MTYLFAIRAYLKSLTPKAWAIIGGVVAVIAVLVVVYRAGGASERAEQAEANLEAVESARQADADAGKAVDDTRNEVEAQNDEARQAANGSDDVLKSALDSLRSR